MHADQFQLVILETFFFLSLLGFLNKIFCKIWTQQLTKVTIFPTQFHMFYFVETGEFISFFIHYPYIIYVKKNSSV